MSKVEHRTPKLEPGRSTYRKNLSISPVMYERAVKMMEEEGFDDFSNFICQILRERYGRNPHHQLKTKR